MQNHISGSICHRKDYNILFSIPGIGDNLAATILSEIGDIHKFDYALYHQRLRQADLTPSTTSPSINKIPISAAPGASSVSPM
ncbi:MAG TPA: hypothetical protein DCM73_00355 [Clostridiales bacterium]|nr:hypothetical protein [Clostridiales bacterium]